jgi:hypothetical protein
LIASNLTSKAWQPAASLVDGRLLREEMQNALGPMKNLISVFAGTQFRVTKAGAVPLKLSEISGVLIWIDGEPVTSRSGAISRELSVGPHTIVLKIDSKKVPESLRLESADGVFLAN